MHWQEFTSIVLRLWEETSARLCAQHPFPPPTQGAVNFMGLVSPASELTTWLRRPIGLLRLPGWRDWFTNRHRNPARPTGVLSGALFGAVGEVLLHLLWEHKYEDHVNPELWTAVFVKVGSSLPVNNTNLKDSRGDGWRAKMLVAYF